MLGPLYRTTLRVWILLGVVAVFFLDVTYGELITSAGLSLVFVLIGVLAASIIFATGHKVKANFRYLGETVAGGTAELKDDKLFEGGWGKVVIPTPYPLEMQSAINPDKIIPDDLKEHWAFLCRHDEYAQAFKRVMCYLASNPQTPAATVRGGHRGATLLEHSFNVWRTMRKEIVGFEYHGMHDRTGKIYFGLISGEDGKPYTFDPNDPLPYLAAISHDIGKIACYQPDGDGRWVEVLPEHDSEGAKILRRLRIYEAMPRDEAQRLIVAVGHYHKMEAVPTARWIDDRCRALLNLLHEVDIRTGELEGEGVYDAYIAEVVMSKQPYNPEPTDVAVIQDDEHSGEQGTADASVLMQLTGHTEETLEGLSTGFHPLSEDDAPACTPYSPDTQPETDPSSTSEIDPLDIPIAPPTKQPPGKEKKAAELDFEAAKQLLAQTLNLGPIIHACKEIEGLLENNWGASGRGLHEKVTSVEDRLPESLVKSIRFIATVRNRAVHESGYSPNTKDMTRFLKEYESAKTYLSKPAANAEPSVAHTVETLEPAKPKSKPVGNPLDSTISDDEIIALVAEVLMTGGAINGKKHERIAYKYREWLYIYEMDLCKAIDSNVTTELKEHYGISQSTLFPTDTGKHADFTRRLMTALANKGALRQEWNGNFYGDRSAYFWVAPARKNANAADINPQQRSQHVIICRAYAFGSSIFRMKSCPYEPVIQGCVYQPLTDPNSIARVKQRMASWSEPPLPEDQLQEQKKAEEKKRYERMCLQNTDISKAPFEPSLIEVLPPETLSAIFMRDPQHGDVFRVDEVLKHFDEPIVPSRIVVINGVRYYSFKK